MPLPQPEPGLVISYSYLWCHEHNAGQIEGRKTRPCVIILAVEELEHGQRITVAPVTHTMPPDASRGVEIPPKVKRHLGLDTKRSWIILDEVNQFTWPGHDLRALPGKKGQYDYGFLPPKLFAKIKEGILSVFLERHGQATRRD